MVSKKDFLNYITIVRENRKGLTYFKNNIGKDIFEGEITQMVNDSDYIARLLLEVPDKYKNDFTFDYWNEMLNSDEQGSGCDIADEIKEHPILKSWSDFYNRWWQVVEKINIT